jgi:o-succinylbenzoate synthase
MKKITLFNVFKFELLLKKELIVKNNRLNKREGLLLNIGTSDGFSGFGEISPLPFLHNESITEATLQVKELKKNNFFIKKMEDLFNDPDLLYCLYGLNSIFNENLETFLLREAIIKIFENFMDKLDKLFYGIKVYPSVKTGFEMALISLLFIRPGLEKIFKSSSYYNLPVCRLVMDLKKGFKKEILEVIKNEYSAVKIKVGRQSLEIEIKIIEKIKKIILENQFNTVKLRIDANGLWNLSEALYFGKAVSGSQIEYIEDPLNNIYEYEQFFKETQIPVALDEKLTDLINLSEINELNYKCPDYLRAIVIKPDFIGGFVKTSGIIKFALSNGIKPVLSNSFNSSLLISFIVIFAGIMNLNEFPLGIDSLNLFSQNLLAEDIKILKGKINILEVLNNIKKINFNLLSPAGF